ncbi:MAG: PA14 domain-containing protein [Planctomycetota bacterium]
MRNRRWLYSISLFLALAMVADAAVAADQNLVGWWRFNDGSGTRAIDSSGNNLHGVLVNDPSWAAGIQGTALQFTGGNHVAVPGYDGILGSQARTSAAWINVTKTNASIMTWGPSGSGTKWVMRTHNNPASLRLECGSGNTYGTSDLADGEWHHVAAVLEDDGSPDVSEIKLYVDGQLDPITPGGTPNAIKTSSGGEFRIAYDLNNTGRTYDGLMDDVRIYNRALSTDDIRAIMDDPGIVTQSLAPDPVNGAIIDTTWYNLTWTPGDLAVSHHVYISESFDDVNEGGVEAIPSTASFAIIGFGEPYPAGLTPGARYYWRVDEVNDAEPGSPWKGDIWSFSVRPKTAWNPVPSDGAMFVEPDTDLTWDPGVGAGVYYVYFGDNFEDVNNAEGAAFITETTYDPGPLELGKTYYWRVDGSNFQTTQRGKVWSFTTTVPGGGLLGEYFNTMDLSGQPVLTRIDPLVDFDYGGGSPEPGVVNDDGFSVRWRGEVQAAFTEAYTFYTRTDDGSRLWIDEQLIVDKWAWVNRVVDTRSEPIQLVAGERYSVRMEWYNEDGNAEAHLLWESASEPKAVIPAAAFSPPVRAGSPSPSNGAVGVTMVPIFKWSPGVDAASHDVYFGTDEQAVADATKASPQYKGSKTLGDESYDPGKLAWHTTYYWRVDEVNDLKADSPWTGKVWSFTTGDFLVVDDFESYNDIDPPDPASNRIFEAWIDGFGTTTNGALVGNDLPPYAEQTIIHGGRQSMPYLYDNNFKTSETTLTLVYPRDWTEEGVAELSLWFRGYPASAGGFTESPVGSYTMTASGTDIGSTADQFHFAYKMLTSAGSIVARVDSVQNTDGWAKAGVMIRETLDAGSKHAFACVTPDNGVASQGRTDTDATSFNTNQADIAAPRWVKLERDAGGNFTAYHSANGTTWEPVGNAIPTNIPMTSNVYVGLALTSHNAAQACEAKFSNVTITGTVAQQWEHQDVGIASNAAEPLYVALSNSTGAPAVVYHDDTNAATIDIWTEWVIPLQAFADQGVNMADVDRVAIGLGTRGDMTAPGGSGKIFIDDINLYRPRNVVAE